MHKEAILEGSSSSFVQEKSSLNACILTEMEKVTPARKPCEEKICGSCSSLFILRRHFFLHWTESSWIRGIWKAFDVVSNSRVPIRNSRQRHKWGIWGDLFHHSFHEFHLRPHLRRRLAWTRAGLRFLPFAFGLQVSARAQRNTASVTYACCHRRVVLQWKPKFTMAHFFFSNKILYNDEYPSLYPLSSATWHDV